MPNLTLSPTTLISLLLVIAFLLGLLVYFAAGIRRRLDKIARQQQEVIAALSQSRGRGRDIDADAPPMSRRRAEPRLGGDEDELESPSRPRAAPDLVARR